MCALPPVLLLDPVIEPQPKLVVADIEPQPPELFSSRASKRVMISRNLGRIEGSASQQLVMSAT